MDGLISNNWLRSLQVMEEPFTEAQQRDPPMRIAWVSPFILSKKRLFLRKFSNERVQPTHSGKSAAPVSERMIRVICRVERRKRLTDSFSLRLGTVIGPAIIAPSS